MGAGADPFFKRSTEKRALFDERFRPLPLRRRERVQWETAMHPGVVALALLLSALALLAVVFGLRRIVERA